MGFKYNLRTDMNVDISVIAHDKVLFFFFHPKKYL